ncbi:hypothetical protein CHS0354_032707 [Potamilus streckersoni]|uniref:Uncharacterized protein n=1 Tax=Potamilus streckersoni TaxID=2493646 RepID=A0AAE0RR81_9BIVA|nr:hypothetical protein CHS0354_032707 [Potamilus streckersoni]
MDVSTQMDTSASEKISAQKLSVEDIAEEKDEVALKKEKEKEKGIILLTRPICRVNPVVRTLLQKPSQAFTVPRSEDLGLDAEATTPRHQQVLARDAVFTISLTKHSLSLPFRGKRLKQQIRGKKTKGRITRNGHFQHLRALHLLLLIHQVLPQHLLQIN